MSVSYECGTGKWFIVLAMEEMRDLRNGEERRQMREVVGLGKQKDEEREEVRKGKKDKLWLYEKWTNEKSNKNWDKVREKMKEKELNSDITL